MGKNQHCMWQPPMKVLFNNQKIAPPQALMSSDGRELERRLRNMRHDLRSSIGIIQNTLYLLQREAGDDVSPRAQRFIDVLVRQASQMEEILEHSRPRRSAAASA